MIPKHDEIWLPALEILSNGAAWQKRDLEEPLARHFELTDDELAQMYDSGKGPVFYDRISWALSYLSLSGLVRKPKRAIYQISEAGRSMLETPEQIAGYVKTKVAERQEQKQQEESTAKKVVAKAGEASSDLTPQEQLYASYENIRQSIYDDILDTILSKSPRAFEELVVKLLEKMGYGGEVENAGEVTQYTNDGGIDGVIKEDVLGLGRVHIQAKRYARENTVGREAVQSFVGALAVAQSRKGVFITTSRFSQSATEYAQSLQGDMTVVLIDGEQLAGFIYDYGLGMQVEQTLEIKKLDGEYWDKMQDA